MNIVEFLSLNNSYHSMDESPLPVDSPISKKYLWHSLRKIESTLDFYSCHPIIFLLLFLLFYIDPSKDSDDGIFFRMFRCTLVFQYLNTAESQDWFVSLGLYGLCIPSLLSLVCWYVLIFQLTSMRLLYLIIVPGFYFVT